MIGIESGKLFARAAFVRTTVVTIIPSPLQRLHGFGYNGIVRIHLSTWLVLQLEGSVHSVPRDVTLPSLDILEHLEMFRYGALKQWVVAMRRPREELEVVWLILFWKIHLAFIAGRGTPDVWGHCSMLLPTSLFARMSCRWVGGQRH